MTDNTVNTENENTRFSQIWRREDREHDEISKIAAGLAEPSAHTNNTISKPKTWGVWNWVRNLALFFLVQLIITGVVIWIVGQTSSDPEQAILDIISNPLFLIVNALSMYAVWIGGMFWVSYRHGEKSLKQDFKVAFKKWDFFIGLGFAAGLFALVYGIQFFFGEILGLDLTGSDNGQWILANEGVWFLLIGVGIASILGPLSEELWFRGFLMQGILKSIKNQETKFNNLHLTPKSSPIRWRIIQFLKKTQNFTAVIVSSIIFGFFHFQGSFDGFGYWLVIIVPGLLGLVLAVMALKFNRLGPSIFAHMIYNFSTLIIGVIAAAGAS